MQQTPPQQQGPPGGHQQTPITADQINLVQGLVEKCIQHYMTRTETIQTLQIQAQIDPRLTDSVWRRLEVENQEFFDYYRVRLRIKEQIRVFNGLVQMQAQTVRNMPPPQKPLRPSESGDLSAFPELAKVVEPSIPMKSVPIKQQPTQYGEGPPMHPGQPHHPQYQQSPYHPPSQQSHQQRSYSQGDPNASIQQQQQQMLHHAQQRLPPGGPQHQQPGMQQYPNTPPNHPYSAQQGHPGSGPRSDAHSMPSQMQTPPQPMPSSYSKPPHYPHNAPGHPQPQQHHGPPHPQMQQQPQHPQHAQYAYGPPSSQGHPQSGPWPPNYNRGPPNQMAPNGQSAAPRGPQSMMHQFVMSPEGLHGGQGN